MFFNGSCVQLLPGIALEKVADISWIIEESATSYTAPIRCREGYLSQVRAGFDTKKPLPNENYIWVIHPNSEGISCA